MTEAQSFTPRFSLVGLGKLGASMAAAIAKRGFEVVGTDVNPRNVEAINAGRSPISETGVAEAIAANRSRLRAVHTCEEAVLASDLTFVVVPTPSDESGRFSLSYAAAAFQSIGRALAKTDNYHVVVLVSTVLPGSTHFGLLPVIEEASGKKAGRDFGVCYSPEFIALGTVMRDFLNPDVFVIGESDERAGAYLARCYELLRENQAPCVRTSFENAELIKISINVYVTMKITFANLLGAICEQLPGADVDVVTRTVGIDQRIGGKYLTAGLGFGGPCFPRDNGAMIYTAKLLGEAMDLAETVTRVNRQWPERLFAQILPDLGPETTVAVLGLAYKPATQVVEESQSIDLVRLALKAGVKRVVAYDPLAGDEARAVFGNEITVAGSARECVAGADVVIISVPDPAFRSLRAADFKTTGPRPVVVFDCWRLLREELASSPGVVYKALGIGGTSAEMTEFLRAAWSLEARTAATAPGD